VTQGRADEGTVDSHLRHSRIDVVPVRAAIFGNIGCEDFLQRRERARREHFCAERVCLQLLQVGLTEEGSMCVPGRETTVVRSYGEIALCGLSSRQALSYLVCHFMFAATRDGHVPDALFLKFDRHGRILVGPLQEVWGLNTRAVYLYMGRAVNFVSRPLRTS